MMWIQLGSHRVRGSGLALVQSGHHQLGTVAQGAGGGNPLCRRSSIPGAAGAHPGTVAETVAGSDISECSRVVLDWP